MLDRRHKPVVLTADDRRHWRQVGRRRRLPQPPWAAKSDHARQHPRRKHVRRERQAEVEARFGAVIHAIQRHLAVQQYYVHVPSGTYIAVWDSALKNYGPNLGYDYGGRLMAAWLDR